MNCRAVLEGSYIAEMDLPKEVFSIRHNAFLNDALELLNQHKILSAPVKHETSGEILGFIDLLDILQEVLIEYDKHASAGTYHASMAIEGPLADKRVEELIDKSHRDAYLPLSHKATLDEATNLLSHGLHRLPIIDESTGDLTTILSQSAMVRHLFSLCSTEPFASLAMRSIGELGLAHKEVVSVDESTKVVQALKMMREMQVSAVGVVNSFGQLLSVVSASDIKAIMDKSDFRVNLDDLRISAYDFSKKRHREVLPPSITTTPSSQLATVMRSMRAHKVHRVFVVDEGKKPIGIVSLKDIIAVFRHN